MKRKILLTFGITLIFGALYGVFRNLPDAQCGVLHYDEVKQTAAGIELCTDGPAGLVDLDELTFPGGFSLVSENRPTVQTPYDGKLKLTGPNGSPLLAHELAITHTEKIHLVIVDESLEDYHHVHPQPLGASGEWQFSFTPQKSGTYHLYAECVPLRSRKQLIVYQALDVRGPQAPATGTPDSPPSGLQVDWQFHEDAVKSGTSIPFQIQVSRSDGSPVALEKVMDAYSHVVAFRESTRGFAHIHPEETDLPDTHQPELSFSFVSGKPGNYRLWAQFQVDGEPVFFSHDIEVI